jgi:hypothetical protein
MWRRDAGRFDEGELVPRVSVDGRVKRLKGDILHFTYPGGISDQLRQIDAFSTARAELYHRQGRRFNVFQLLLRPYWKFFNTYILRSGFLDGWAGFIISTLSAYHVFVTWAKLWEIQSKASSSSAPKDDAPR